MTEITILHVTESFAGGTLTSSSRLVRGLNTSFRHVILHGMRHDTPADYLERFPRETRLVKWRYGGRLHPGDLVSGIRHLTEVVAEVAPNIVHAHSTKAGAICRMSPVWRSAKVLYSPRGYSFQRTDVSALVRLFFRSAELLLAQRPHLTIACGERELRQAKGLAARRVVKIDNMVDLSEIGDLCANRGQAGPLRVAMLGYIAPAKNFPLLVEIARKCIPHGIEFEWVGGGVIPEGIALPPNFTITGMLGHRQALERLATAHVYIHTSRWEGLSNAVLEAMALAMPVVVSPASCEVVCNGPDGPNGFVCETADDYVQALQRLAQDRSSVERFGRNSRCLVKQKYAPNVVLAKWSDLYMATASATRASDLVQAAHS